MTSLIRHQLNRNEWGIETIGIWGLEEKMTIKYDETKAYAWWGICKKTRKVAFMRLVTNTIYEALPIVMNNILLSDEFGGCEDGKYCLNLECPYSLNSKLITSIKKQQSWLDMTINENSLVRHFEKNIKFINENFLMPCEGITEDDLNKIFVEDYSTATINVNAFTTTLYRDV